MAEPLLAEKAPPPRPPPQAGQVCPSGTGGASGVRGVSSPQVGGGAAAASPPGSSFAATPIPTRSGPMGARVGLGRCAGAFWMALLCDAVGLAILLVGVFLDVFFADLLIYGGGVGIFFSLLWWVFWYVGNLEVPQAELQDDVGLRRAAKKKLKAGGGGEGRARGLAGIVRTLSLRLSFTSFPHFADSDRPHARFASSAATGASALELQPA
ncbi:transmembrane protein 238-like [Rhineura floridana]|uniref:transmembrane protein 238-like n=1 Tax=Rhineura floridana TaxID=261503 RepID=UPI002AC83A27|nr:transmembrane protein 238-like [Rhineura floridana]